MDSGNELAEADKSQTSILRKRWKKPTGGNAFSLPDPLIKLEEAPMNSDMVSNDRVVRSFFFFKFLYDKWLLP